MGLFDSVREPGQDQLSTGISTFLKRNSILARFELPLTLSLGAAMDEAAGPALDASAFVAASFLAPLGPLGARRGIEF